MTFGSREANVLQNRAFVIKPAETRELAALFSQIALPCRRKADELLMSGNSSQVILLVSGWAFSYRVFDNGQRQIINIHLPGDVIGLTSLIDDSDDGGCLALTDVSFLMVTRDQLMKTASGRSDIAFSLTGEALRNEMLMRERLSDVARRPARQRIANFLYELCCRARSSVAAPTTSKIPIPLTQDRIADAIGLTSIHVSRTLKEFKQMGVIEYVGHDLRVNEPEQLRAITTFSSSYIEWLKKPSTLFRPAIKRQRVFVYSPVKRPGP